MRFKTGIFIATILVLASFLAVSCGGAGVESQGFSFELQFEQEEMTFRDVTALDSEHAWAVGDDGKSDGSIYYFDGHNWKKQYAINGQLNAVSAVDRELVWAAGNDVFFFNGAWSKQFEPPEALNDIFALDEESVWAVGQEGGIYHFDGLSWSKQHQSPGELTCVLAIDPRHVWAVGVRADILFFDGNRWERQSRVLGASLLSISGPDNSHLWAAGTERWLFHVFGPTRGAELEGFIAFFDGASWEKTYDAREALFDVSAPDKSHAWATGSSHLFFYDGSEWGRQFDYKDDIYGVCAPDANHVWAAGGPRIYFGER